MVKMNESSRGAGHLVVGLACAFILGAVSGCGAQVEGRGVGVKKLIKLAWENIVPHQRPEKPFV